MSKLHPRILIFDSGVGGLSIFAEVQRQVPAAELVFASDSAGFPYGIRSETDLTNRVEEVISALINEVKPDIVIIACNSASTVVLPIIRSRFETPFVGVVPAIKPAVALSHNRSIGLIATPATVSRAYTKQLIEEFAQGCKVEMLGSSELVYLAEEKLRGKPISVEKIAEIIAPLFAATVEQPLDTIVLACTHFPLLREELELAAPRQVQWIDSAEAIARRTQSLLGNHQGSSDLTRPHRAIFTGLAPVEAALEESLTDMGIVHISNMDI